MSEEVIVTLFKAETSELDAALNRVEGGLRDVTKAEADAAKAGDNLNGSMGSLAAKTAAATEAAKRQADALSATTQQTKALSSEVDKSSGPLSRLVNGIKEFSKGAAQGFKQAVSEVGGLRGAISQIGGNVRNSLRGWANSAKEFKGSIGDLAGEIPGLGSAFRLLSNPITAVVAAVGGLLFNFTRLDSVADTIEKVKAGFSSFLDALAGNASLSDTIAGIERAVELAERLDNLNRTRVVDSAETTRAKAEAAILERQARNRTLSEGERVSLLKQANALLEKAARIDQKNTAEEARIAYEQLVEQVILQNNELSEDFKARLRGVAGTSAEAERLVRGLAASGLEVNDESLAKYIDSVNKRKQEEADFVLLQERNQNRIDALTEQGIAERQAAEAKAQAEAEKRAAAAQAAAAKREQEQQQNLQQTKQIEDKIAADRDQREFEALQATRSANDQQLAEIDRLYEQRIEAANGLYDNLIKLAQQRGDKNEVLRLEKEKNAAVLELTQQQQTSVNAKTKEFTDKELKERADALKKVEDLLLTDKQRELKEIDDKYSTALADVRKFYSDANGLTEEGKKKEKEIIDKWNKDIKEVNDKDGKDELEAQIQRQEDTVKLLSDSAAQATEIVGAAAANGQLTAEEASKALTLLALDTIEKLVLMNAINAQTGAIAFGTAAGGPAGTLAGLVQGAAVAALIKGLFAALKASIQGAYTGEAFIDGPVAFPGESRDAHLRRVHYGERIVTADANRKHWDILQAVANDRVEDFVNSRYVIPAINAYMSGDTGQRMASSVMLAQYYDKNIVTELRRNREALDGLPIALASLLAQPNARTRGHRRYW